MQSDQDIQGSLKERIQVGMPYGVQFMRDNCAWHGLGEELSMLKFPQTNVCAPFTSP